MVIFKASKEKVLHRRTGISLQKKAKILSDYGDGSLVSKKELARTHKVSPKSIRDIVQDAESVRWALNKGVLRKTKRLKPGKFTEIESEVVEWISDVRQVQKLPVPIHLAQVNFDLGIFVLMIFKKKAFEIAQSKGVQTFKASIGWIQKMQKRNGISVKKISGEASSVNLEEVKEWQDNELPAILSKYEDEDIWNLDETGLYYEALPNKTLEFKSKFFIFYILLCIDKAVAGTKESKKRITLVPVANKSGNEKKMLAIGSAAKPRPFKRGLPPIDYTSSANAWMNSKL